jgi:hypothetical protein
MSETSRGVVTLRRRSSWEAADMGILLWRNNWGVLLLFFGIPYVLLAGALSFLPENFSIAGGLAAWWLLPFFDRFALQVVSVRFFEPRTNIKRLFKGLGNSLGRGIAGDLLWRRFSPFRSARMPIMVLEKLKGSALRRRKDQLSGNGLKFGFLLTLLCLFLKSILVMGELTFIFALFEILRPGYFHNFWGFIESGSVLYTGLIWITQLLVETLYVCMGFGLYINSRVETEGWDIELLFKNLHSPVRKFPSKTAAFVLALGLALFCLPSASGAQEKQEKPETEQFIPPPLSAEKEKTLREVLESPDFGVEKPSWDIRLRDRKQRKKLDLPQFKFPDFDLPWFKEILGNILRITLAAAIAAGIGAAVFFLYRQRGLFKPRGRLKARGVPGRTAPGNPEKLLEEAAALHKKGKIREAWALCLKAFSAVFAERFRLYFPPEATEYETLALVKKAAGKNTGADAASLTAPFDLFVGRWIQFAYGGKTPEEGCFENSLAACRSLLTRHKTEASR